MAFLIKANDADRISWISPANPLGCHSLTDRAQAAEFATREAAQATIDGLPEGFAKAGIGFSIESAETDS
jgi:hypothetical protein